MLDQIKNVHQSDHVFNNIDPRNIVLNSNHDISLMNFEYMTKLGDAIDPENYPSSIFQSITLLKKKRTPTFKDDIVSIFYVIMYFLGDRKHVQKNKFLLNRQQILEYRQ